MEQCRPQDRSLPSSPGPSGRWVRLRRDRHGRVPRSHGSKGLGPAAGGSRAAWRSRMMGGVGWSHYAGCVVSWLLLEARYCRMSSSNVPRWPGRRGRPTNSGGRFLRGFVTFAATLTGTCCGIYLAAPWGLDAITIGACLGAVFGAGLGVVLGPFAFPAVRRLGARIDAMRPTTPPPLRVFRLGSVVGSLEGALVGAVYGGLLGAMVGGLCGVGFGPVIAVLAWRVRRSTPLFLLGLLVGGLIEAGGGLLLGLFVKRVTSETFILLVLGASLFTVTLWGWLVKVFVNRRGGPGCP